MQWLPSLTGEFKSPHDLIHNSNEQIELLLGKNHSSVCSIASLTPAFSKFLGLSLAPSLEQVLDHFEEIVTQYSGGLMSVQKLDTQAASLSKIYGFLAFNTTNPNVPW